MPIAGAIYWLLTSGHPQHVLSAILAASLFTLTLPWLATVQNQTEGHGGEAWRFPLRTAAAAGLGLLCAAAYALPFAIDFLRSNAGRVGADYAWTIAHPDTLAGLLNNFLHPLRSDVHGAFGGSSLLLLAVFIPLLPLFRIRVPLVTWVLWGSGLLTFLYLMGDRTFVHPLAYRFVPFINSIRIPGRMAFVLPAIFTLLLVWIVEEERAPRFVRGQSIQLTAQTILSLIALLAMALSCVPPEALATPSAAFAAIRIRVIPLWVEPTAFACGALSVAAFGMHGLARRRWRALSGVALVAAALQTDRKWGSSPFLMLFSAPFLSMQPPTVWQCC